MNKGTLWLLCCALCLSGQYSSAQESETAGLQVLNNTKEDIQALSLIPFLLISHLRT